MHARREGNILTEKMLSTNDGNSEGGVKIPLKSEKKIGKNLMFQLILSNISKFSQISLVFVQKRKSLLAKAH